MATLISLAGIALRLAIGLGLHRELPFWSISPFEREVRYVSSHCGLLTAGDDSGGRLCLMMLDQL